LPTGEVAVSVVDATGFELEGVPLLPVQVGRTDTDVTTIVPDIALIVAGDVIDNGVRPLRPATVIAGHKDARAFDTAPEIQSARRYLTDAPRLLGGCTSAEQFYRGMLALHPHRLKPGLRWDAAITMFPPARPPHSRVNLTHGDSSFIR
jgi:hypothetical protein